LKLAISSLLLVWMAVQVAAGQTSTPQSELFLVRISDVQVNMTPTAGPNTVGNCMVAYPGGRSYLELHRQEFFYGSASVVGYEGKLSAQELTNLRAILDSAAVKSLLPFPMPTLPMASHDFWSFIAEIQRGTEVQKVGTLAWQGRAPKNSEEHQSAWEHAGLVLQPLIQWARSVKSIKPPEWQEMTPAARIAVVDPVCIP